MNIGDAQTGFNRTGRTGRSHSNSGADGGPSIKRKDDRAPLGDIYLKARRWSVIIAALRQVLGAAGAARYLEIGCGSGDGLVKVAAADLGFQEIVGIDLRMEPGLRESAIRHGVRAVRADATRLPFPDGSFDLVVQCMLLTSVLSRSSRVRAADEIIRVVRQGGHILSFDLRYPPPPLGDRATLGLSETLALFSRTTFLRSSTHIVLPPLARLFRGAERGCDLLGRIPLLRTYRLAVFQRSA